MLLAYQALWTAASYSSLRAQLNSQQGFSWISPAPLPTPGVPATTCHTSERQAFTIFVISQVEKPASQKEPTTPYTVKLRGAPFNVTEVCVWKGRVGMPVS